MRFLLPVKKLLLVAMVALLAAACANQPRESVPESTWRPDKTEPAIEAAKAWLALVDSGDAAAAWDQASALFKAAVSKEQWQTDVAQARESLGAVKSRSIKSAIYETSLPGVPDGEYVVIVFDSEFTTQPDAMETVTPAFEDGVWKVSGYYVQ